ncbi:signal peptidase I [Macrococcus equipercicus]|uniref:Signal peptidase I n=1 Tax=Macrococcus equipercicus TaxID=69967 RepID=A0ABQ6R8V0_9STAP|nr:signal peptidase I [Macrococcus equipercicus]KAA1039561.1 signal peptidase I [Macrococcus equipercicus]
MNKEIKEWLLSIIIVVFAWLIISTFIGVVYKVSGDSMFPTFKDKDKVIVSKISNTTHTISRGDVIVFHANKKHDYIKRLIGVPGDKIESRNDVLYINNIKVDEDYLKENKLNKNDMMLTENFTVKDLIHSNGKDRIPKNKYLVLGDNREVSIDSRRSLGLIDKDQIVGKVVLRIWPFNQFHINFYPDSFNKVNDPKSKM